MDLYEALGDPTRRKILTLAGVSEFTAGDLASHFDMSRPAVSQHLTKLKQCGLITERRQGTKRLYKTHREALTEAALYFAGFWDDRLASLRRLAETEDTGISAVETERVCVEKEVLVAAAPAVVWSLLTEPSQMNSWMGMAIELEVRPGGRYFVEVVPDQRVRGEFVVVEPIRRLSHTWGWEDNESIPPGTTIVTYELMPTATGTLLHLSHRNLDGMQLAGTHARGWSHYLQRIVTAATGKPIEPDPWVTNPQRLNRELLSE